MPWSNQSGGGGKSGGPNGGPWGGGGNNNGGGGGPWGNGPRPPSGGGGGGGGNQPPDLEEIIRRGQDKIRSAIPGGAGNGSNKFLIGVGAIALIALWAMKAVYTVEPDERGVELLFGSPKTDLSESGLHIHWWPLETVEIVNVREQLRNIGSSRSQSSLMLSGDQNIVDVEFSVAYQVVSPQDYLFKVSNPDVMLQQVAESAMREVVGRRPAQDIFRDDRDGIAEGVRATIQSAMDEYGTGLSINAVSIEDAAPPREVADAFEEVQRAEQDEDRFVEEANKYSNEQLGKARGEAAQILEEASAYKTRIVQEAEGEAQRFISVYDEYALAPEVTRKRLFLETMEGVFRDSNKVIMEQGQAGGQGVVPYLPLPEVQKRSNNNASGGTN